MLNLTKFIEQYRQVEVFGAQECTDSMMYCTLSNLQATPIQTECVNSRALPKEQKEFGYATKNIMRFVNPLKYEMIEFPNDATLQCDFNYDTTTWNKDINDTLVIRLREFLSF